MVEHSAGAAKRRAPAPAGPARQAGPPNVPCAPPGLLRSCDGLVAFVFDRISQRTPRLPLFRRYTIMKNALIRGIFPGPDLMLPQREGDDHAGDEAGDVRH